MKISVENLSKKYGDKLVLEDLTFTVDDNEIIAIVGPNGAGKTTLLETMMTLRSFDQGKITLMGNNLENKNLEKIRRKIGVIFQEGGMYPYLKTKELLQLFASFYDQVDQNRIDEVIDLFDLSSHMTTKFQLLSGGWKQRVLLAIAFLHQPELLFLDEPTTGLDPEATQKLWEAIDVAKDKGATIVLTTHSLEEIDLYADKVLVLNQGEIIIYDEPGKIKEFYNASFFKEAYFKITKEGK